MGWKAIGNFVGRDARTARRWEAERGLPIHRIPGGGSASVWADGAALRTWLANDATAEQSIAPAHRWRTPAIWIAAALIIVASTFFVWGSLSTSSDAGAKLSAPYGTDQSANATYQAASYAMNTRSVAGLSDAVRQFTLLANQHPRNAAAFVGLAETNLLLREFNALPDEVAYRRAGLAAQKALEIDPRSPGGLRSLAFVKYWSDGDRAVAFELFRRAIAEDPNDAQSYHWYGTALFGDGRFKDALAVLDRARTLNPGSSAVASDEAYVQYFTGDRAASIASLKRVTVIDPEFSGAHRYLAALDLVERDDAGFLEQGLANARLTHDAAQADMMATVATAYRTGGRPAMLASLIAWAERAFENSGGRAIFAAQMNAIAGNREASVRWLARAEAIREPEINSIRAYPAFLAYRNDPAFKRYFGPL